MDHCITNRVRENKCTDVMYDFSRLIWLKLIKFPMKFTWGRKIVCFCSKRFSTIPQHIADFCNSERMRTIQLWWNFYSNWMRSILTFGLCIPVNRW